MSITAHSKNEYRLDNALAIICFVLSIASSITFLLWLLSAIFDITNPDFRKSIVPGLLFSYTATIVIAIILAVSSILSLATFLILTSRNSLGHIRNANKVMAFLGLSISITILTILGALILFASFFASG